jgi:hypothetical protein
MADSNTSGVKRTPRFASVMLVDFFRARLSQGVLTTIA